MRRDGGVYLTPRGWVAADDLTPSETADLAEVFEMRDARFLDPDCFVALCAALGLDVIHAAGRLMARWRGRRAA